ncbi:DNA polymerase alpha, subunit B [Violaceomyces palustris]|uniref:DNA polymerase alpha, subunit B n=1 Tax=Violaceomyces palustris TaxID=1673888 RepID=A0ACD0P2C7_9BASI|nr:DNA polymerase alpha, subunit B [Violaceomyces palustris]
MSSNHPNTSQQLCTLFGEGITKDPSLLNESISICNSYHLSPNDLFYKWEAFAINHLPKGQTYNLHNARELRKLINSQYQSSLATPLKPSNTYATTTFNPSPGLGHILGIKTPKTPISNTGSNGVNSVNPFSTPSRSTYRPNSLSAPDQDVSIANLDTPSGLSLDPRSAVSFSSALSFQPLETLNSHLPLSGSGAQSLIDPPRSTSSSSSKAKQPSRVALAVGTDPKAWNYRYMFEKKGERSQVLDDRIDHFAALIRDVYNLQGTSADEIEFGDPSMPSQEPIYVVGRICPNMLPRNSANAAKIKAEKTSSAMTVKLEDGSEQSKESLAIDDPSGLPKLAETGVMLESSRMMGSGNRIPIFLQKGCKVRYGPNDPGSSPTVGLFPGMIVCMKGMNGGGERFGVEEILMPPPLPHAVTPREELLSNQFNPSKLDGKPINLLTASGPFTEDSNLDFTPWHRLMDEIERGGLPSTSLDSSSTSETLASGRRGMPDVVLLLGPFLPASHPELAMSDLFPSEIFRKHISARLQGLLERSPATTVILIPSTNDIVSAHVAFPQPYLEKNDEALGLPKRVRCLPNPCLFYINEVVIAASTADVLKDLRSEELIMRIENPPANAGNQATASKDAMSRLCRHVLGQRSFYPLFPSPPSSLLPLDISHSHLLSLPSVSPDILFLPSSLKHFIRVVDSTVVINPGRTVQSDSSNLSTNASPSSLASIQISAMSKSDLERGGGSEMEGVEEGLAHKVYERARVEILEL